MEREQKRQRYERVRAQLEELFRSTEQPIARMASAAALLHAKMSGFSWTGFYLLDGESLTVGPYQGPLACMSLAPHTGVCWAAADRGTSVVVDDVHAFPGHIACDERARSEVVVPVRDRSGRVVAVLDVDAYDPSHFDEVDREGLEAIAALIHAPTG